MERITIKESTIVRPAQETPRRSLWISNLDLVMARYHLPTVYFYKPNEQNGGSNLFDPSRLKEALSKTLVSFYPLAGRLGYDENGRLEIICNGEGILFIEAETSSVMDHLIGDYNDDSEVFKLVPKVDYSGGISSYPLLVLQVTTFKCGGVCLGVGFHHTIADGTSAPYFINSWADIARGVSPSIAPFIDRTLLRARVPPTPMFHHVEYDASPSMNTKTNNSIPTAESGSDVLNKPSTASIFKLTVDQLNTLKAKLNIENVNATTNYSTFNILTAHIWRCISKARGLLDDQATKLFIYMNGRSRLSTPLPPGYFGNVVFRTSQIALAGDLQSEPFIDTVNRIHELLKQGDEEYMRSAIDYIEKAPNVSTLVQGLDDYRCPNLVVHSWMWLPINDADFGWGRPIYMGPAANVIQEGRFYILRTPSNDGSLLLVTRLETSYKKLFNKLFYEF